MKTHTTPQGVNAIMELLEQTRTNTIDAAIAALPEKLMSQNNIERTQNAWWFNNAIDQAKSNILKLKKG
jgi:hypothetical protein